jgi:hypothetical protein
LARETLPDWQKKAREHPCPVIKEPLLVNCLMLIFDKALSLGPTLVTQLDVHVVKEAGNQLMAK